MPTADVHSFTLLALDPGHNEADGVQVGTYTVLDEVARGGMGVVYRARGNDGSIVALKLLLPQRAANAKVRQRFQAEVEALARLKHPGIVGVREHGEHQGCPWLALDFVEGETLQTRLRRGPLRIDKALNLARQLGEALDYVHGQGLLHRDLKPDNVLLRGDQALLTDFGLVLDARSEDSRLTATGAFLGTPGYWPPEQALGAAHLCTRQTDVFGLGALLYACLTGNAPIQANTLQEALESKSFRSVTSPRRLRPGVPDWLSALCMRCLQFAPNARPQTASEVVHALEGQGAAPASRLSSGWVRGIAASGAASLLLCGALWLLRGGPAPHEPTPAPLTGEETRELVTGEETRELDDSTQQADDTQALVDELLGSGEALYEAFQPEAAIHDYSKAIALAPDNALAYACRSRARGELGQLAESRADAERALDLDPDCGLAHSVLGQHAYGARDYSTALARYTKAIEQYPENAQLLGFRADCLGQLERYDEALRDLRAAIRLEPRNVGFYVTRAQVQGMRRAFDLALADLRRATAIAPDDVRPHRRAAEILFGLNRFPEALETTNRLLELEPDSVNHLTQQGSLLNMLGRPHEALAPLNRAIELDPTDGYAYSQRSLVHMAENRFEQGVADIDRVIELGTNGAVNYYNRGYGKKELGRSAEALVDFDTANRLRPRNLRTHLGRVECFVLLGRYDQAMLGCKTAFEIAQTPVEQAQVLVQRAGCRLAQGHYTEAVADYDQAAQLFPANSRHAIEKLRDDAEAKRLAEQPR